MSEESKRPTLQPIGVYVSDEEHEHETVDVIALSERALAIWFFAADPRIQALVDEQTGSKWVGAFDAERTRAGHALLDVRRRCRHRGARALPRACGLGLRAIARHEKERGIAVTYAARTGVSTAKSRAEIETMLQRAGAKSFAIGWDTRGASIVFELHARKVKLVLPLPLPDEKRFILDKRGRPRAKDAAGREWDYACRARWRALVLIVKAKLEAVASNVTSFETEFMAHILMPDGQTVAEIIAPAIERSYMRNRPLMLGAGP